MSRFNTQDRIASLSQGKGVDTGAANSANPANHPDIDDLFEYVRPPAGEECARCREYEAQGVRVIHCGACDVLSPRSHAQPSQTAATSSHRESTGKEA